MESTRVEICFAIEGARSEVFESLTNLKITINYCIHAKMSLINDDIQWFLPSLLETTVLITCLKAEKDDQANLSHFF